MCDKMREKMEKNASFQSLLWTSNETHFKLEGKGNSKNTVFCGSEKLTVVAQTLLHSAKCTV